MSAQAASLRDGNRPEHHFPSLTSIPAHAGLAPPIAAKRLLEAAAPAPKLWVPGAVIIAFDGDKLSPTSPLKSVLAFTLTDRQGTLVYSLSACRFAAIAASARRSTLSRALSGSASVNRMPRGTL